ncbi:MAG: hypothetical protein ACREU2_16880 [Steroidobacteraceae bacterium]
MAHNRFLITHIGSLPRQEQLRQIMFARENGIPLDQKIVQEKTTAAVELEALVQGAEIAMKNFWSRRKAA